MFVVRIGTRLGSRLACMGDRIELRLATGTWLGLDKDGVGPGLRSGSNLGLGWWGLTTPVPGPT